MTRVAFVDGESSAAGMPPQLQHRICGALSAAGFDSTGRKIRSGDYKGVTAFARVQREPDYPPPDAGKKRGASRWSKPHLGALCSQQPRNGAHQALSLTQRLLENHTQRQAQLNCQIGVAPLTTPRRSTRG
jgi:hypothetical protein